ncbi:MAG: hypothetical protein AAFU53_05385 [Cyanobacteria bacterium J06632_3]
MDRIQLQASKLWELLFAEETAQTYQNTLNLTGTILKESAQLIWLIICSVFVFGAWFSDASVKTGNSLRTWLNEQSNPTATGGEKKDLAATGKSLLDSGRTSAAYLLAQAREQLGLEANPPAPVKKKTNPAPQPTVKPAPAVATQAVKPAPEPVTKPTPEPVAATPVATQTAVQSIPQDSTPTLETEEVSREDVEDDWPPQEEE